MKNYQTIYQNITDDLRKKMITGIIKGGERIRIEQVAREYGVSNMPAREAIKRLESEGFLEYFPYRGAIVKELSIEEVGEIFKIRQILESAAAQISIQNLTPQELSDLDNLLSKMEKTQDLTNWLNLNWQFHETIYQACKLPRFCKMIRELRNDIHRYLVTSLLDSNLKEKAQIEHRKILSACRKKDPIKVDDCIREHLRNTSDALVNVLRKREMMSERGKQ